MLKRLVGFDLIMNSMVQVWVAPVMFWWDLVGLWECLVRSNRACLLVGSGSARYGTVRYGLRMGHEVAVAKALA